jgi:lathosterol oxidase
MFHMSLSTVPTSEYVLGDLVGHLVSYFGLALGVFFLLFKTKRFEAQRINPKAPSSKQLKSEIKSSLISTAIFTANGGIFYYLHQHYGFFKLYENAEEHGLLYFFLSPLLLIFLHDTYFYWTHRAMHHPKLFKRFHKLHHQSYSPTPFTIYAFNVGEAIVDAMYVPLFALVLPLHPIPLFIMIAASIVLNLVGHLGHELYSQKFFRSIWSEIITTTTHHHLHHQGGPGSNYGFYFRFWDRVCKTEDPRYAIALRKFRGYEEEKTERLDNHHVPGNHAGQLAG